MKIADMRCCFLEFFMTFFWIRCLQVSAAYDYDGVLMLDSRNFRGMTETGVFRELALSFSPLN
jgi:hypothetical protein